MLLRGAFLFRVDADDPIHSFDIRHPQLSGLTQARIRIRRFGKGRYVYSSQASLQMEESACGFRAERLAGFALWWTAWMTVLKRPGWPTLRPFLRALLVGKMHSLDDLLAVWMVDIETNDGRQEGEAVVFADGFRCPLVSLVQRRVPFARTKLVLFPHFEPNPDVSETDVASLRWLQAAGYDIVVLSTSLGAEALERLDFVNAVVVRPNVGHDFFSWKVGFQLFDAEVRRASQILLLNNSVAISGPGTLTELDALPDGFGCLFDSRSGGYHADSFCLVFKNLGGRIQVLFDFFDTITVYQSKQRIITEYELGLTQFLLKQGFELHAAHPCQELSNDVLRRAAQYPQLARRLRSDPTPPNLVFYDYLLDEGVSIMKKRRGGPS